MHRKYLDWDDTITSTKKIQVSWQLSSPSCFCLPKKKSFIREKKKMRAILILSSLLIGFSEARSQINLGPEDQGSDDQGSNQGVRNGLIAVGLGKTLAVKLDWIDWILRSTGDEQHYRHLAKPVWTLTMLNLFIKRQVQVGKSGGPIRAVHLRLA